MGFQSVKTILVISKALGRVERRFETSYFKWTLESHVLNSDEQPVCALCRVDVITNKETVIKFEVVAEYSMFEE